jgi:hypothetical protein
LPKPNNSAPDNIALRTILVLRPLFIKLPLVANKVAKRALMPLFFRSIFSIIQLPNPNNSALDNIAFRQPLSSQPLFIKLTLVANKTTNHALMPLFFCNYSVAQAQ